MSARLFCRTGEFAGTEHRIGNEATIGRAPENTVVIPRNVVSQRHARLFFDEQADRYVLEDLGSRNGTSVDGVRVHEQMRLGDLHIVTFAGTLDFFFQALAAAANPESADRRPDPDSARAAAPKTTWQPPAALDLPAGLPDRLGDVQPSSPRTVVQPAGPLGLPSVLQQMAGSAAAGSAAPAAEAQGGAGMNLFLEIVVKGRPGSQTVTLRQGNQRVGRAESCEIHILEPTLSREHATLTVHGSRVIVTDLDSRNGTFIGDRRISGPVEMQPGVAVELGEAVVLRLVREGPADTVAV